MEEDPYVWELEFENGSTLDRISWSKLPKDEKIDPNNPGIPVKFVRLKVRSSGCVHAEVSVPPGLLPVVARQSERTMGVGPAQNVVFKIGYNHTGLRNMLCVAADTGKVSLCMDYRGYVL